MPADELQVQAITAFFTKDCDATRFCGLGADATIDDVKRRFGEAGFEWPATLRVGKNEVPANSYKASADVEVGGTSYKHFIEVYLPEPGVGFPFIDLRLVRQGYVMAELKAAAAELKKFFTTLHGRSMTFERGGVAGEVWVEANGSKRADEALKLTPSASLRVRVAPKR